MDMNTMKFSARMAVAAAAFGLVFALLPGCSSKCPWPDDCNFCPREAKDCLPCPPPVKKDCEPCPPAKQEREIVPPAPEDCDPCQAAAVTSVGELEEDGYLVDESEVDYYASHAEMYDGDAEIIEDAPRALTPLPSDAYERPIKESELTPAPAKNKTKEKVKEKAKEKEKLPEPKTDKPAPEESEPVAMWVQVKVVEVVDGATLKVLWENDEVEVGLRGVASPDKDEPGFEESRKALRKLIAGDGVDLEFVEGKIAKNDAGMLEAEVWVDGRNINRALLDGDRGTVIAKK